CLPRRSTQETPQAILSPLHTRSPKKCSARLNGNSPNFLPEWLASPRRRPEQFSWQIHLSKLANLLIASPRNILAFRRTPNGSCKKSDQPAPSFLARGARSRLVTTPPAA